MADTVIWSAELAKRLSYKSKAVEIKGYRFTLSVDQKIADLLHKDHDGPRQQQAMVDDANRMMEAKVKIIDAAIQEFDVTRSRGGTPEQMKDAQAKMVGIVETHARQLAEGLKHVPQTRWDAWVKTRKDYKSYKLGAGVSLAIGTCGFVGSIAGVAGSIVSGGATLVLALIGLFRSIVSVVKKIDDLWQEAEGIQTRLVASANNLQHIYNIRGKQALGARSTLETTFNAVLGSACLPSLNALESNCKLWRNKLNGIDVAAGDAAALAVKSLAEAEKLEKLLQGAKTKQAAKALAELTKLRKLIHENLESCHAQSARCKRGRELHWIYDGVVQRLKRDQPEWSAIFDKLLPAASQLALTGANAHEGLAAAHGLLQVSEKLVGAAAGVGKVVKELIAN